MYVVLNLCPTHIFSDGYSETLQAAIQKYFCLILVSLMLLHWSLGLLVSLFVVPLATFPRPIRSSTSKLGVLATMSVISVALLGAVSILTGESLFPVNLHVPSAMANLLDLTGTAGQYLPTQLFQFIREWSSGRLSLGKSLAQIAHESVCHKGLLLEGICLAVLPGILFAIELAFTSPNPVKRPDEELSMKTRSDIGPDIKRASVLVVAMSIIVYHLYSQ